jgi:putative flavoprotein involved in K+ transport
VFLSVGSAGRAPRRYRGKDFFVWLRLLAARGEELGTPLPPAGELADPRRRLAANPHLSGLGGGHDTDLRRLASDGVTLTGRLELAEGEMLRFAADLSASLAAADRFFDERFRSLIDTAIERAGIEAPPDDRVAFRYHPPELTELDLERAGVGTVLWASGYRMDYGWIEPSVFDDLGFPLQRRGVTSIAGLHFIGSLWQHTQASATLFALDLEAHALAARMGLARPGDELEATTTPWAARKASA